MAEEHLGSNPTFSLNSDTLERHIQLRTFAQVRGLRVEAVDGQLRVRGYTTRYYVKQLVLAALRELENTMPIDVAIEVG